MQRENTTPTGRRVAGRGTSGAPLAAALVVASIALAGLPAEARAQATADTIRACYVPASGTIYRIKAQGAPASCVMSGHVEFSWSAAAGDVGTNAKGGSGGGGNTTDHGSLDGLTDDDHPQYLLTDGVRQALNGFAVTGDLGQGTLPVSGPGLRMMWYPNRGAFRAGRAFDTEWDGPNIGLYSVALGGAVRASGHSAVALGAPATASGSNSFATSGGTASGNFSRAMGRDAVASGQEATAIGENAKAGSTGSTAIGQFAQASGTSAVAIGMGANATQERSGAYGPGTYATGRWSTALGYGARASGIYAIALGTSQASGDFSVSIGWNASTNGKKGAFVYTDASNHNLLHATADNQFVVRAQRFWFGTTNSVTATPNRFIETSTGAYLSSGGAWVSASDSTKKHLWQDVDGEAVLAKLAALPIRTWSYREEDESVRHMGPTAQEFYSAFTLGDTERAIASVDADGVALAAAQALEQRTRKLDGAVATLAEHTRRVDDRLAALEALVAELEALRTEVAELRAARAESRR